MNVVLDSCSGHNVVSFIDCPDTVLDHEAGNGLRGAETVAGSIVSDHALSDSIVKASSCS